MLFPSTFGSSCYYSLSVFPVLLVLFCFVLILTTRNATFAVHLDESTVFCNLAVPSALKVRLQF